MKLLILLMTVLLLCSCGKKDDEPFSPIDIRQVWNTRDGVTGQIDLRDLENITIFDMENNGVFSDCSYKSDNLEPPIMAGKIILTLIAGDPFVCNQMTGQITYYAFRDNDEKKTTMQIGKTGLVYYYKL